MVSESQYIRDLDDEDYQLRMTALDSIDQGDLFDLNQHICDALNKELDIFFPPLAAINDGPDSGSEQSGKSAEEIYILRLLNIISRFNKMESLIVLEKQLERKSFYFGQELLDTLVNIGGVDYARHKAFLLLFTNMSAYWTIIRFLKKHPDKTLLSDLILIMHNSENENMGKRAAMVLKELTTPDKDQA